MTPLSLGNKKNHREPDLASRVVASARQCYFLQEIVVCLRHCEQEHCRDEAAMTLSPTIQHDLNFGLEQPCFLGSW